MTSSCQKLKAVHVHPRVVIQDFEMSVCHLQIKHKGSILHKYPYFATLILLAITFPFPQHELISAEKAKLWELVGEVEEAELEGEAVVWGPSGEATTHSSGSTPPFFKFCLNFAPKYYLKLLLFFNLSFPFLLFSLLSNDSAEEEAPRLQTKEERDIDTLQNWVQVGGFPAQAKEEAWGLLTEVNLFYLPFL